MGGLGTWTAYSAFREVVESMDGPVTSETFLEAARNVGGLLAGHRRVGRARVAGAGRAVAGQAGRDAAGAVAGAIEALADLVELHALVGTSGDRGVVGDARTRLLGGEPGAEVAHVLVAQRSGERGHQRGQAAGALAVLELRQLGGDVALRHAGDARRVLLHGVAIQAVAGGAGTGLGLAGGGVAPGRGLVVQRRGLHRGIVRYRDRGALGVGNRCQRKAGNADETKTGKTHAELHNWKGRPRGR